MLKMYETVEMYRTVLENMPLSQLEILVRKLKYRSECFESARKALETDEPNLSVERTIAADQLSLPFSANYVSPSTINLNLMSTGKIISSYTLYRFVANQTITPIQHLGNNKKLNQIGYYEDHEKYSAVIMIDGQEIMIDAHETVVKALSKHFCTKSVNYIASKFDSCYIKLVNKAEEKPK